MPLVHSHNAIAGVEQRTSPGIFIPRAFPNTHSKTRIVESCCVISGLTSHLPIACRYWLINHPEPGLVVASAVYGKRAGAIRDCDCTVMAYRGIALCPFHIKRRSGEFIVHGIGGDRNPVNE